MPSKVQKINWEAILKNNRTTEIIEFLIGLKVPLQIEYPEKDQIKISFQKDFVDQSAILAFKKLLFKKAPEFKRIPQKA